MQLSAPTAHAGSRSLFAAGPRTADPDRRRELASLLWADRRLAEGWWLVQRLRRIYTLSVREEGAVALQLWWQRAVLGDRHRSTEWSTRSGWRDEILTCLTLRVTNGSAEGKASGTEVIIHQGHGYRPNPKVKPAESDMWYAVRGDIHG